MTHRVCRRTYHTQSVACEADSTAFAGENDELVMSAVATTCAGKAVRKNAEFEAFANVGHPRGGGYWHDMCCLYLKFNF